MNQRNILLGVHGFNSVSAVAGGIGLMGGGINVPEWVVGTDFPSLYFPSVILFAIVGGSSMLAAMAMSKHATSWQLSSLLAGVIMLFWIGGEIVSINAFHWLQAVYIVTGVAAIWLTPPNDAKRVVA